MLLLVHIEGSKIGIYSQKQSQDGKDVLYGQPDSFHTVWFSAGLGLKEASIMDSKFFSELNYFKFAMVKIAI